MNKIFQSFSLLFIGLFIFVLSAVAWGSDSIRGPVTVWDDISSPTPFDVLDMAVDIAAFFKRVQIYNEIKAVEDKFPQGVPIVIEANVIRHGSEKKVLSHFEIQRTWVGFRNRPMPNLGVKNFNGLVQISSVGTGPTLRDFPGVKIILTPASQDVDMCGAVHLGVIAEFSAGGSDHRITMPDKFVKWDHNTFNILKLEDGRASKYGLLVARRPYETYIFYPAQEGRHHIGVTVGGMRDTAVVNISPAKLNYLELIPNWNSLASGNLNLKAMAHYKGECRPPMDVTDQVQWSSQTTLESQPLKLEVVAPSNSSGQVALCKSVPLQAFLINSPGKKMIFAHYKNFSASLPVDDSQTQSPVNVTNHANLIWSTGSPVFQATRLGNFFVTATDGISGLSASLNLEVVPPTDVPLYPLASIQIPGKLVVEKSVNLTATAFSCNGMVTAAGLKWLSLTPGLLDCTAGGACTARKPGTAMVALLQNGNFIIQRGITIVPKPQTSSSLAVKAKLEQDWRSGSDEAFLTSLYKSILDRNPKEEGLRHWERWLKNGKSREWVMKNFFSSSEYKIRNKSDAEFIRDLYQATMGREPTEQETAAALSRLKNGTARTTLLAGMVKNSGNSKPLADDNVVKMGKEKFKVKLGDNNKVLKVNGRRCWPRNYITPSLEDRRHYGLCDRIQRQLKRE